MPSIETATAVRPPQNLDKGTGDTDACSASDGEVLSNLSQDMANNLVVQTEARLTHILDNSSYVKQNCRTQELPEFCPSDISIGATMIAKGGFSTVHPVESFNIKCGLGDDCALRGKKFVVKALNPKLALNARKLQSGARDLVKEAHFLSSLDHENIIKVRGWSKSGIASFAATSRVEGFFLVYDRLELSLFQKLNKWYLEAKGTSKNNLQQRKVCKETMDLYRERLEVALQLSKGLGHLHKHRIVHMDVKPGNVGFDSNGVVKLFDFGLATELPPSDDPDEVFALPNHTGTPRFMAPEIITKKPFNCKSDTYSFSIVLWEMLALQKPYDGYSGEAVKQIVGVFDDRPEIPRPWPKLVKQFLRRGWNRKISIRPTMDEVSGNLSKMIDNASKARGRKSGWFRIRSFT